MSIALDSKSVKRAVWVFIALLALFATGCSAGGGSEELGSVQGALCSGTSLVASPAGSASPGATVQVTATGTTCGAGESAQYVFFYYDAAGTFTRIQDWSSSPTANWNTTGVSNGAYGIYVGVRVGTSGGATDGAVIRNYFIGGVCNNTTLFTVTPPSPSTNTTLQLSAGATCTGGASPEFRFGYYKADGSIDYVSGFVASPFTWKNVTSDGTTGTAALSGTKTLVVRTRAIGNSSVYESEGYASYQFGSASTLCNTVGLAATQSSPAAVGATITLTGSASPCSSPEYEFSYRPQGNNPWYLLRTWGGAGYMWNTAMTASGNPAVTSGTYEILVRARNTGTSGTGDSYSVINFAFGSTCSSVSIGFSPTSPSGQGKQVLITGAATCTGGATAEYTYWYQPFSSGALQQLRGYGPAPFTWDTSAVTPNVYTINVYARAIGSAASYESVASAYYTIAGAQLSSVASGLGYSSCALVDNDTARCWGDNSFGQLGNGTTTASSVPVAVSGVSSATSIAVGNEHACAVISGGTVRCWGHNVYGQLGNGGTADSSVPVTVTGVSDAVSVSLGMNHSCVLRTGGAVSCWGNNAQGQTGSTLAADFPTTFAATAVAGISGASALAVGGFQTCVLVSGGVKCWGDNNKGALGNGAGAPATFSKSPVDVTGLTSGVTAISSGEEYGCAVLSNGTVQCWGDNAYGQLGDGTTTQQNSPVSVSGVSSAVQVSAGHVASCVRLSSGGVSCWGRNDEGELGNGNFTSSLSPVSVSGLTNASSLSTGGLQSCVMVSSGGAKCWGYNALGQLGNGSTASSNVPVAVTFP